MAGGMRYFRASDGAELAFAESASGTPALVFVHGWQADHAVWRDAIDFLGPKMHTVAVDLRGSGESRNAAQPYRLERFAADLRELVDALQLGSVVVVGHSMGATVALRFAVDAPEATRGLVLIAPVPASGGAYSAKGEAYLRATAGDPVAARNWLARTFAHVPDEATLERVCAAAAKTGRDVALESFESWAHADFAEATRAIKASALVIAPEHDVPEVHERKVAALLPNARYVVLPECAHYALLEKPREIAELIREFVSAGHPSTGSG
jgi:pimeloyl-ACP methyl ester carboxylesterase